MSLISLNLGTAWKSGMQRKESRTSGLITLNLGEAVWAPRDYASLAKYGYQLSADVFTCVSLIASSAKQIRLFVSAKEGGEAVDATRNDLARLIAKPNARTTLSALIEHAVSYKLLSGNSYIERVGTSLVDETLPPRELWTLRPDRMQVLKGDSTNPVKGYRYTAGGKSENFPAWQILHQKSFHPLDDWYGMSPLEAAGYPVDIGNECARLFKRLLQKGQPAGWVEPEGDWDDEQIADLKRQVAARSEGGEWIFGQGIKAFHEMGFNPEDGQVLEGRAAMKRDVAAVYRVPSQMIGDTSSQTYANYKEARKSLYTEAVIPEVQELVDGLNNWLSPLFSGAWINIDRDSIDALAEDRDVAATRAARIFTSGIVRRNEARAEMGFEALPEALNVWYQDLPKPAGTASGGSGLASVTTASADRLLASSGFPDRSGAIYEFKCFNLGSEEEKELHWKAVEKGREAYYDRYARKAAEVFADERVKVLVAFRDAGEKGALRAVDIAEDGWDGLLTELYSEVATDFGKRTLSSLKSHTAVDIEIKAGTDVFTRALIDWLMKNSAEKVAQVSKTTKSKIRRELAQGVAEGETIFELSKRLESMYRKFSDYRAERIARTEVISASNLGSHVAAQSTGIKFRKTWLSTFDRRTRSWHSSAHGQARDMDALFDVHGEKLMWPGDSSHGATGTNVIQCRCTQTYRTV